MAATKYLTEALLGNSFDLVSVVVVFVPSSHIKSYDTAAVGSVILGGIEAKSGRTVDLKIR